MKERLPFDDMGIKGWPFDFLPSYINDVVVGANGLNNLLVIHSLHSSLVFLVLTMRCGGCETIECTRADKSKHLSTVPLYKFQPSIFDRKPFESSSFATLDQTIVNSVFVFFKNFGWSSSSSKKQKKVSKALDHLAVDYSVKYWSLSSLWHAFHF